MSATNANQPEQNDPHPYGWRVEYRARYQAAVFCLSAAAVIGLSVLVYIASTAGEIYRVNHYPHALATVEQVWEATSSKGNKYRQGRISFDADAGGKITHCTINSIALSRAPTPIVPGETKLEIVPMPGSCSEPLLFFRDHMSLSAILMLIAGTLAATVFAVCGFASAMSYRRWYAEQVPYNPTWRQRLLP